MRCPQCLMENPDTATKCRNCRQELAPPGGLGQGGLPQGNDPWAGAAPAPPAGNDPWAGTASPADTASDFLGAPEPVASEATGEPDRSMFGESTIDLGGEEDLAELDPLDLESTGGPIGGEIPLGATPPGIAGMGGPPPPLGGTPAPATIPQDAPSMFDTSSFVPQQPVGPPPEAYDRFDAQYFAENLALLPEVAEVHGSRNRNDNAAVADEFFQVERTTGGTPVDAQGAPQTNESAGYRPPTPPKKS